jgi:hypothetical protein
MLFKNIYIQLLISLLAVLGSACKRNEVWTSPSAVLEFSTDTLSFDTVFTGMGTSTQWFKIYNPYDKTLKISNIRLAGGSASNFRVNVDGMSGLSFSDIELRPKDSLYVFVNVYINPAVGDAIRTDKLIFELNGNNQEVTLQAYGWNAIYIGRIGTTTVYQNGTVDWNDTRPYIIFGQHAFINSTLRIAPNTKIYMYGGPTTQPAARALIYIGENATIEAGIGGNFNQPVEIRTHRLEDDFQHFPFHHDGIFLSARSLNNKIHNCIIRNGSDAIQVDSLSVNTNPKLELENVFIYDTERSMILGRQASIKAKNCVFANSNSYGLIMIRGGESEFKHCTFGNYGASELVRASKPVVSLRDFEVVTDAAGAQTARTANGSHLFQNCIIYGERANEIETARAFGSSATFGYVFDHCLVKADTFNTGLQNCIKNRRPLFRDVEEYNYATDSSDSPAVNAGTQSSISTDILGRPRDSQPDLGAYEYRR